MSASAEEIVWWQQARPHIAEFVRDGLIWVDPSSGEVLKRCPWLHNDPSQNSVYTCEIYHDRPEECRQYPTALSEMARDECEMLEASDLRNPETALRRLHILNL